MYQRQQLTSPPDGADTAEPVADGYLTGYTPGQLAEHFRRHHSRFAGTLRFDGNGSAEMLADLVGWVNEFDSDDDGRGDSYRVAQGAYDARLRGIETLLKLVSGFDDLAAIPPEARILDVLGGDGLLARALDRLAPGLPGTPILTSDVAAQMVQAALKQDLPAVRQPAHHLFLEDGSFDGVLVAYGTHHIAPEHRPALCSEAHRVLKPGGRVVIHDFETGSPVAAWFSEIVHPHSKAGHEYRHFTTAELHGLLVSAGFAGVSVGHRYDPIRAHGRDEEAAVESLLDYLIAMYGLTGVHADGGLTRRGLRAWLERTMVYNGQTSSVEADTRTRLSVEPSDDGVRAELPRYALVASAVKPREIS